MTEQITPWMCMAEWHEVSKLIQSLEAKQLLIAEEIILSWQLRVQRLPTGVEATLCLIQAALSWCRDPRDRTLSLTISAALIRFLNITSHVGLNKFDLTKIQDVAKLFKIPEFLVELRHDSAHGEMKSKRSLLEGLALAIQWVIKNYWQFSDDMENIDNENMDEGEEILEVPSGSEETSECRSARMWLECYQYLMTYSLWGMQTIGDLKENPETFDHVIDLWGQLKWRSSNSQKSPKLKRAKMAKSISDDCHLEGSVVADNVENVALNVAVGQIRQKVNNWMSSSYDDSSRIAITRVLVNQHLLMPDREFIENLLESGEDIAMIRSAHKIPTLMLQTWNEILNEVAKTSGLLSSLVLNLHKVCSDESGEEDFDKDVASAWICEILKSISQTNNTRSNERNSPFSKKGKLARKKDGKKLDFEMDASNWKTDESWQDFVSEVLLYPNSRTPSYAPYVMKLKNPPFSKLEENQIVELIDIYVAKKSSKIPMESEEPMKSLSSLISVNKGEEMKWRLVEEISWETIPLGLCPGETEDDFLLNLQAVEDKDPSIHFSQSELTFVKEFPLTEPAIDWNNLSKKRGQSKEVVNGNNTPAFYR